MRMIQASLAIVATVAVLPSALSQTIVDVAVNDGRFTKLVEAVTDAGLVEPLSGEGPLTVFAPIDDAFADVPPKFLTEQYSAHLENILMYHVIDGAKVLSSDLSLNMEAETLNGEKITVTSLTPPKINDATVINPDVEASNGVVHVIDKVLLPSAATKTIVDLAVATPELSTLVELVTAADLAATLSGDGPFTVFAPSNDAFAELPSGTIESLKDPANREKLIKILTFHVIPDDIILSEDLSMSPHPMIEEENVIGQDVLASNGVVHVINKVLIPPTIVDIAVEDGRFTKLVQAVTDTGLVEPLSGDGPFTVFAPIDDAFADVPPKFLTEQYSAHLTNILMYHVIAGAAVLSSELSLDMQAATLNGENITVTSLTPPKINDVDVIIPDLDALNGVVHVIDEVLLPSAATKTTVDLAVATPELSTLVELVTEAGLAATLSGDGPFTVFAPSNDAFAKLPSATLDSLKDPANREELIKILSYHVIPDDIILNEELSMSPHPMVDEENVIESDVLASNGVVHVINEVLIPQTIVDVAVNDGRFTKLVQAVTDAGLIEPLSAEGPLTVFAPVDDAFAAVPPKFLTEQYSAHLKNILMYHVIDGAKVLSSDLSLDMQAPTLNGEKITVTSLTPPKINDVDVIIPDLGASNGVVHVIDKVLLPSAATKTIVDLAGATPELSTLVELVTAAGLAATLSEDGPFTVFAPSNDAFAKLPSATLESLKDPANREELIKTLTYHVISDDIILSEEIADATSQVSLLRSGTNVSPLPMIDEGTVIGPDVLARNGVVHVINKVLIQEEGNNNPPVEVKDTSSASAIVALVGLFNSAIAAAFLL